MSRMQTLPTSMFRFFQLPERPDNVDLAIVQLLNLESELAEVHEQKAHALVSRYFGRLEHEQITALADQWMQKPDRFQLWLMCSSTIGAALRKLMHLGGVAHSAGFFAQTEQEIALNYDAVLTEKNALEFAVRHLAKSISYSLMDESQLTIEVGKGFESFGRKLEDEGFQVRLGKDANRLVVAGRQIAREPLKTSNPVFEELFAPASQPTILAKRSELSHVASLLIRKNLASPDFSINELAKLLCMSPRSLQRRLLNEGLSYSQLLKAERFKVVSEMLHIGISKEEIGEKLGYTDLSSIYKFLSKR
ncbi:TPA: helix-turn-helix domain-containing protein [Pseudomonas aeruginosa]